MIELAALVADHFRPLVGEPFTLEVGGAAVEARLLQVDEAPRGPAGFRRPFAIVFAVPPGTPLAQGIFPVEHPALGRHELFLTARPAPAGGHYEAVFA